MEKGWGKCENSSINGRNLKIITNFWEACIVQIPLNTAMFWWYFFSYSLLIYWLIWIALFTKFNSTKYHLSRKLGLMLTSSILICSTVNNFVRLLYVISNVTTFHLEMKSIIYTYQILINSKFYYMLALVSISTSKPFVYIWKKDLRLRLLKCRFLCTLQIWSLHNTNKHIRAGAKHCN